MTSKTYKFAHLTCQFTLESPKKVISTILVIRTSDYLRFLRAAHCARDTVELLRRVTL